MASDSGSSSVENFQSQCCFFCLLRSDCFQNETANYYSEENASSLKLKHIFRFLCRDNNIVISGDSDESKSKSRDAKAMAKARRKLLMSNCDTMVTVCQDCAKLTREFSELYSLMEEIRLRLNWSLQKFQDKMMMATKEDDKHSNSGMLSEDMANLRNAAKVELKHATSWPRVLLQPITSLEGTENDESESISDEEEEEQNIFVKRQRQRPLKTKSINHDDGPDNSAPPSHVPCHLCRAKFRRSSVLHLHMLGFHCDSFFPNHKLDSVTDSQFQKILVDLLFQDFISEGNKSLKACPLCDWPFAIPANGRNKTQYLLRNKMHFIDSHFSELEGKLREIQENPELFEKFSLDGNGCHNPEGGMCKNDCGAYFGMNGLRRFHENFYCMNNSKQLKKTVPKTVAPSKRICTIRNVVSIKPGALRAEEGEGTGLNLNGSVNGDGIQIQEPVTGMDIDIGEPFLAKRIKMEATNDDDIIQQDSDSEESSMELISDSASIPIPEGKKNSKSSGNSSKKSRSKTKTSLSHEACPYCRAQFKTTSDKPTDIGQYRLRRHIISLHCGPHYFPSHKLDFIEDSEFQKILVELLFQSFFNASTKSCPICKTSFLNHDGHSSVSVHDAKGRDILAPKQIHFIDAHFKELEDKLEEIQRDPELSKILEECNPAGRMCKYDCGMHIVNRHAEGFHDKLHCPNHKEFVSTKQKDFLVPSKLVKKTKKGRDHDDDDGLELESAPGPDMELGSCPYCNFKSNSKRNRLYLHVAKLHPEHFFLDLVKQDEGPESEAGIKQIRKILADIILPELIPESGNECLFCAQLFNSQIAKDNKKELTIHLAHKHGMELRKRLKIIQQDPGLEERLRAFEGEFCRCGMYFPGGGTRRKITHHKKFQCKYLPPKTSNW